MGREATGAMVVAAMGAAKGVEATGEEMEAAREAEALVVTRAAEMAAGVMVVATAGGERAVAKAVAVMVGVERAVAKAAGETAVAMEAAKAAEVMVAAKAVAMEVEAMVVVTEVATEVVGLAATRVAKTAGVRGRLGLWCRCTGL